MLVKEKEPILRVRASVLHSPYPKVAELVVRYLTASRTTFPSNDEASIYWPQVEALIKRWEKHSTYFLEFVDAWLDSRKGGDNMLVAYDFMDQMYTFSYAGGPVPTMREHLMPSMVSVLSTWTHDIATHIFRRG